MYLCKFYKQSRDITNNVCNKQILASDILERADALSRAMTERFQQRMERIKQVRIEILKKM